MGIFNKINFFHQTRKSKLKTDVKDTDLILVGERNSKASGKYADRAMTMKTLLAAAGGGSVDTNTWNMTGVAFVDPVNGNDTTAVLGDGNLPYRTIVAAQVPSSNLIYCLPGNYFGTQTLVSKKYYFEAGAVIASGGRIQDGGASINVDILGHLTFGVNSYGAAFTGSGTIANVTCNEFDLVRSVASADNGADVTVNCNRITSNNNNGGGFANVPRNGSKILLNVKESCITYHWLVASGGGGFAGTYNEFTINCPDIRVSNNNTFGNGFKALINDQGLYPCKYYINGKVTHEETSSTSAFGIVDSALLTYVNVAPGETGSEFYFKGGCESIMHVCLAYYILTEGIISFKDGDYKSTNGLAISSFAASFNGAANIIFKAKNCRFQGDARVVNIGHGRKMYFEECSFYAVDIASTEISRYVSGNAGAGTPELYLYNCIGQDVNVVLGSAFLDDAGGAVSFNTVNTFSNLPIGAGVLDNWGGYAQIVTFQIAKI